MKTVSLLAVAALEICVLVLNTDATSSEAINVTLKSPIDVKSLARPLNVDINDAVTNIVDPVAKLVSSSSSEESLVNLKDPLQAHSVNSRVDVDIDDPSADLVPHQRFEPHHHERNPQDQQCPCWMASESKVFLYKGQNVTCICLKRPGRFFSYQWKSCTHNSNATTTTTTTTQAPDTTTSSPLITLTTPQTNITVTVTTPFLTTQSLPSLNAGADVGVGV